MTETRSLHRKLAQVMYEAERIPKNGTAPREMGGYKFVQVGDAADYIRKALAEKVITMMPTAVHVVGQQDRPTKSGGSMTTVDLLTEWTLTDGESGESITIMSFGSGADGGDKYSGKASTSAMKYALLTGFLLSTGEDTEGSNLPEQLSPNARVYSGNNPPPPREDAPQAPTTTQDGGLIGTAEIGKSPSDFELRVGPDGSAVSFRLVQGRQSIKVVAKGSLADALAVVRTEIIGKHVTCWGKVSQESFVKDGKAINYRVLTLDRIAPPDFLLPADGGSGQPPKAEVADGPVESDRPAAPSTVFSAEELAAIS